MHFTKIPYNTGAFYENAPKMLVQTQWPRGTYDLANKLRLPPSQRAALGVERVEGLREWLAGVQLKGRLPEIEAWLDRGERAAPSRPRQVW